LNGCDASSTARSLLRRSNCSKTAYRYDASASKSSSGTHSVLKMVTNTRHSEPRATQFAAVPRLLNAQPHRWAIKPTRHRSFSSRHIRVEKIPFLTGATQPEGNPARRRLGVRHRRSAKNWHVRRQAVARHVAKK
jgi:hypothetical protein